ncbi:MAG: reverse gyrase [Brevinematia bacterium]
MDKVHSIYKRGCISCGGEITDARLTSIGICEKCLLNTSNDIEKDFHLLSNFSSTIKDLINTKNSINEIISLFKECIGSSPWNTQISWFKRIILGRSFSLVAPTGVGKTTFGIVTSLFLAKKGKKSIIILPTTNLVDEVSKKLINFSKKLNLTSRIINYSSKMSEKIKSEFKRSIKSGDYDIVVITSSMVKNIVSIKDNIKFDFVFADDVDAILKRSKNIDNVIMLTGFSKEDVELFLELIKTKFLLAVSKKEDDKKVALSKYEGLIGKVQGLKSKDKGILVVSSATAKPRGPRVKLFKELFNFEVGVKSEVVRNVGNYYLISNRCEDDLVKLINLLGDGGIVFVPTEFGLEYAEIISQIINTKTKFKSEVISSKKTNKSIEEFRKGKVNILIGVSTYYGSLVRGIDIPERIVYSVFLGLPRFKVLLDPNNLNISSYQILRLILEILPSIEDGEEKRKVESFVRKFRNNLNYDVFVNQGKEILSSLLKEEKYFSFLKKSDDVVFIEEDGSKYILIFDLNTYLQASGRTSRLYPGGMTRGVSIVIESNEKLIQVASRRYKWIEDIEWEKFDEEKIKRELEYAWKQRKELVSIIEGKVQTDVKLNNKTILIVVESPTKAQTISKLFGTPTERIIKGLSCYEVSSGNMTLIITASKGHLFELVTDNEDIYGMRLNYGYPVPVYDTIKRCLRCNKVFVSSKNICDYCGDSKYIDRFDDVKAIIEIAKEVDEVLLASDPDTEGEKISFDIFSFLYSYIKFLGGNVRRMKFNEVTYNAIKKSIENPENIDEKLVEAQLLRRIQDRLIGFGLSSYLKEEFGEENISAGRVQSPVLGWIINRYEEYKNKKNFIEITFVNKGKNFDLSFEGVKGDLSLKKGQKVEVKITDDKSLELAPLPPFTTDSILVQANRIFGMSSDDTMSILQELFEGGFITYHRTESTTVSKFGQNVAKEYLGIKGFDSLSYPRGWESEGAHECIRPTKSIDAQDLSKLIYEGIISGDLKKSHILIYDLIFKRFIASQMKNCVVRNVSYAINLGSKVLNVSRNVEILENGWNVFGYLQIEDPLEDYLVISDIRYVKKPTVALFSEGDIVQMMKQKGIGRPSTYSKIIMTLIKRNYVINKNKRLIPTSKGIKVYSILNQNFRSLVSEERTKFLEDLMDNVELGERNYFDVLQEIFEEFKSSLGMYV